MANYTCDLNTLLTNAKCFLEPCFGPEDREAIEIYLKIQNLKASGGADYTGAGGLAALLIAAKQWQVLACNQRKAIELWMDMENAIFNGASFATDANSLRSGSACILCVGHEYKKAINSFLKCQLNSIDQPD